MDATNACPAFGGRLKQPQYYEQISNIVRILKGKSTLRTISQHLNSQGFLTPTGLPFTRDRLVRYIKSNPI